MSYKPRQSPNSKTKSRIKRKGAVLSIIKEVLVIPTKCKGSVKVSRNLTQNIIPNQIAHKLHDVFDHMDNSMVFDDNKITLNDDYTIVINFGFHEQKSNEELFCVIKRQEFQDMDWRMLDKLFTAKMIENIYKIPRDTLPSSFKPDFDIESFAKSLGSVDVIKNIINNTRWHKLPIHHTSNNKERRELHLLKEIFMDKIRRQMAGDKHLVPIIAFTDGSYQIEYVWIFPLTTEVTIGISFTNKLNVTAIHLDKEEILKKHQLVSWDHDCHCLKDFVTNIDDLKIGNVNNQQNQINALKKENKKLRNEHKDPIIKYVKSIMLDLGEMVPKDEALAAMKKIFNAKTMKQQIKLEQMQMKQHWSLPVIGHPNQQVLPPSMSNYPMPHSTLPIAANNGQQQFIIPISSYPIYGSYVTSMPSVQGS